MFTRVFGLTEEPSVFPLLSVRVAFMFGPLKLPIKVGFKIVFEFSFEFATQSTVNVSAELSLQISLVLISLSCLSSFVVALYFDVSIAFDFLVMSFDKMSSSDFILSNGK